MRFESLAGATTALHDPSETLIRMHNVCHVCNVCDERQRRSFAREMLVPQPGGRRPTADAHSSRQPRGLAGGSGRVIYQSSAGVAALLLVTLLRASHWAKLAVADDAISRATNVVRAPCGGCVRCASRRRRFSVPTALSFLRFTRHETVRCMHHAKSRWMPQQHDR